MHNTADFQGAMEVHFEQCADVGDDHGSHGQQLGTCDSVHGDPIVLKQDHGRQHEVGECLIVGYYLSWRITGPFRIRVRVQPWFFFCIFT